MNMSPTEIPITSSALNRDSQTTHHNPLPQLLHTPSGLALLELQGTINLPAHDTDSAPFPGDLQQIPIGRLIFPDYNPELKGEEDKAWMKRAYLYVGKHQRLTGEVKKLPKAIAVLRKKKDVEEEELEVVEIVKWKILFSNRPEPVGTWDGTV